MKTAVRETSVEAFHSQNFGPLQRKVLDAFKILGESCIADVSQFLNIDRSTISPRVNELKKVKVLEVLKPKRPSVRTGKPADFLRIAEIPKKEFKETFF